MVLSGCGQNRPPAAVPTPAPGCWTPIQEKCGGRGDPDYTFSLSGEDRLAMELACVDNSACLAAVVAAEKKPYYTIDPAACNRDASGNLANNTYKISEKPFGFGNEVDCDTPPRRPCQAMTLLQTELPTSPVGLCLKNGDAN